MNMSERIKERRTTLGYTQEELGNKLGLQKSAIAKYENGRVENLKRSVILKMAEALGCTPSYLMGYDDTSDNAVKIPVLGRVAAGIPYEAIENITEWEEIPSHWKGTYKGLVVKGDSMSPQIMDGDTLIVRLQDTADSGEVVIAIANGEDATCKKLIKHEGGITLQSFNPLYEPMYFSEESQASIPVQIWGKVVEIRRKL